MDDSIRHALTRSRIIDMTTTGARTGQPRRIEIVAHVIDGHTYISGVPSRRTRAWIRNLQADPNLTFHLKGPGPNADIPAVARIVTAEPERRAILTEVARVWRRTDVDVMVEYSPLIEVTFPGLADTA